MNEETASVIFRILVWEMDWIVVSFSETETPEGEADFRELAEYLYKSSTVIPGISKGLSPSFPKVCSLEL